MYQGSFAADVLAAHKPSPIKGIIWLGALPYVGDVLPIVATPLTLGFLPGFMEPESPGSGLETRINFCKTLVAEKRLPSIPFTVLSTWIGLASLIPPSSAKALCSRSHDPSRLKEEAANGLPLCVIHGKDDLQVNGQAVVDFMKPIFKDFEAHLLDGVGHFSFYEAPTEVADIIIKFVNRVK
jgi:pimeloyl-ACP methyl ester carboxylesterase